MINIKLMLHPTRAARKDGAKAVVLRVTNLGQRHYISMGLACTPEQWNHSKGFLKKAYNPENYGELNITMKLKLAKAEKILLDMESTGKHFNIDIFKSELVEKRVIISVSKFFDQKVDELIHLGRVGNASVYKQAKNSLNRFLDNKAVNFHDINMQFLVKYESHLRQSGCVNNTIDNYMRTLRALYNTAISQGLVKREYYPFYNTYTRSGYQIGKLRTATVKRAITMTDLKKIQEFKPKELSAGQDAKFYFLFSYFAWGINFVDMAYLRWDKNIQGDTIVYSRAKTRHTKTFRIQIKPQLASILAHYKNYSSGKYIFPIFNEFHNTPVRQKARIKTALKKVNKSLGDIGKELEISTPLTTYVARHTFASTLKSKEIPASVIKEMMGHASEETTEIYLKEFSNDVLSIASEHLNIE